MSTLAEIEAAADSLSSEEKKRLLHFLAVRLHRENIPSPPRTFSDEEIAAVTATDVSGKAPGTHSVLDIPPLSIGGILRPISNDDDLLGEMLEDRV